MGLDGDFIFYFESPWNDKKWTFCEHIGKKVISLFRDLEWEETLGELVKAQRHTGVQWDSHDQKEVVLPSSRHPFPAREGTWSEGGMEIHIQEECYSLTC